MTSTEIISLLRANNMDSIDLSNGNYGVTALVEPIDNISILEESGEEPALMVYDDCGDVIPFDDLTIGEQTFLANRIKDYMAHLD